MAAAMASSVHAAWLQQTAEQGAPVQAATLLYKQERQRGASRKAVSVNELRNAWGLSQAAWTAEKKDKARPGLCSASVKSFLP